MNPITLYTNESQTFSITYEPNNLGLVISLFDIEDIVILQFDLLFIHFYLTN